MPGVRCIIHQLRRTFARAAGGRGERRILRHVTTDLSSRGLLRANVSLLRWGRFPHDASLYRVKYGWRWSGSRVLDKLNVLGAPYRRVVWLDADVHIQRNVDELCDALPDATRRLAAAFNSGHEPRTCWQPGKNPAADECRGCRHHGVTKDEREGATGAGLAEQDAGKRRGLKRCVYEVNPACSSSRRTTKARSAPRWSRRSRAAASSRAMAATRARSTRWCTGTAPRRPPGAAAPVVQRRHAQRDDAAECVAAVESAIVHLVGPRKPWSAAAQKDALAKPHDPYLLEERRWLKSCKQFAPDTSSNRTARLEARAGG